MHKIIFILLVLLAANAVFAADVQWVGSILDEITIQHQPHLDGDFNNDGVVDSLDIGLFSGNWLGTGIWP
jgi:hypothetical protein